MDLVTIVFPAVGWLIAIAARLFLIRAGRYARRPAKAEMGLMPTYTERAGGRFDALNWTIPFVRVATYPQFVSISCITQEILLRRGEVTGIEKERHLLSTGLRIHHTRPDLPGTLILWPRNKARLEAELRASLLP